MKYTASTPELAETGADLGSVALGSSLIAAGLATLGVKRPRRK